MAKKEIERALSYAEDTKFLKVGEHIINEISEIFAGQFPDKKAVVVADKNTYSVAGATINQYLSESGLASEAPLVIEDPDLYANYRFVQKVADYLKGGEAIAIAVGSGVINDLTKVASSELGRPYMSVATAASMDGYAAYGASITKEGAKQTIACPAPKAIIADLAILCGAPAVNSASGYADLYAKVTAGADWIFADALGVEPLDNRSWHVVQDGLEEALKDPAGVKAGKPAAIEPLIEGLMLGGFAMQSLRSSRPASGAEHQFSHLWDMEHHTFNGKMADRFGLYKDRQEQAPSHGFKVGIGLLTTTALYDRILATPLDKLEVKQAVARWKPLQEQIIEAQAMFEDPGVKEFVAEQITGKFIAADDLEKQLIFLKNNWTEIRAKLKKQIIPYEETKKRLMLAGAPVSCEQIGITRSRLRESFYKAQKLRSRFTVLDVGIRTGYLDRWIDELFSEEGIF